MQRASQPGAWGWRVTRETALSQQMTDNLLQKCAWDFVQESDGIRTHSRLEGASTISIHIEGVVQSPLLQLLVLFNELNYYRKWYPHLIAAEEIRSPTVFSKYVHFRFNAPWPLSPRYVVAYAFGVDLLEESNTIAVGLCDATHHSMMESDEEVKLLDVSGSPALEPDDVRATLHICGHHFTPLTPSSTLVRICVTFDMKASGAPQSVITFMTREIGVELLKALRTQCLDHSNAQDILQRQEEDITGVYGYMEKRLQQHFKLCSFQHVPHGFDQFPPEVALAMSADISRQNIATHAKQVASEDLKCREMEFK